MTLYSSLGYANAVATVCRRAWSTSRCSIFYYLFRAEWRAFGVVISDLATDVLIAIVLASRTALREELCDAGAQQRALDRDRLSKVAGQISDAVAAFEAQPVAPVPDEPGVGTPGRYSAEVGTLLRAVRQLRHAFQMGPISPPFLSALCHPTRAVGG